ncbi:uncharacterized protein Z518_09832 [Rhinocladiella mackenziei CBS 650.93]|uniref:Rhinocladiella mackenziei CBS 650.93 unplaced genomic scaffold supercont1.8, whole genome shotgun sequence n=1 Tax=Rhinocladiella mackenziei CBS 650.93 TaxID=1442369 RepID=A0A0D2FFH0_9EURO|nr:uncharacterized protein Z518_09832 [Rhinocladiella mackenziei CBS 650.93]KIX00767.1 hypothetical protein Z518_09832 [Rhinocladiella mackenziei CBS 650.93]
MAPKLEIAFTMRAYLNKANVLDLGAIKSGPQRVIVPISHGFLDGSGVHATILPGGSDWSLVNTSGNTIHLDVRTQARSDDEKNFYIHYNGVVKFDESLVGFFQWGQDAKTTSFGDHHWFTMPIMETNHTEYKWVEETVFVGQGRCVVDSDGAQAVEYQIYRVMN